MQAILAAVAVPVCICLLTHYAHGAERYTANTLQLAAGEPSAPASLNDMSWLTGVWRGSGLGAYHEETWSVPRADVMMGMYRMIRDEVPVLFEFLLLRQTERSLVLQLKHFDSKFSGWEQRDQSATFPFVAQLGARMYFSGLTFERVGSDDLVIYVAIKEPNGSVHEVEFRYKRETGVH
jgi:hypothetical protein